MYSIAVFRHAPIASTIRRSVSRRSAAALSPACSLISATSFEKRSTRASSERSARRASSLESRRVRGVASSSSKLTRPAPRIALGALSGSGSRTRSSDRWRGLVAGGRVAGARATRNCGAAVQWAISQSSKHVVLVSLSHVNQSLSKSRNLASSGDHRGVLLLKFQLLLSSHCSCRRFIQTS